MLGIWLVEAIREARRNPVLTRMCPPSARVRFTPDATDCADWRKTAVMRASVCRAHFPISAEKVLAIRSRPS